MKSVEVLEDINLIKGAIDGHERYLDNLLSNIKWHDKVMAEDGSLVKLSRKMAYVADQVVAYKYNRLVLGGQTWTDRLLEIRAKVEEYFGKPMFNSCLLNLYEDGSDEIRWHADKEEQLGENPTIACVNLGHTRNFWFLNKETGDKVPYPVDGGDLLIMGPNCQKKYLHAILKEKDVKGPRISLTYRWVY